MRCRIPTCNAELYPGDLFCGVCGLPVSTVAPVEDSSNLVAVTLKDKDVDTLTRFVSNTAPLTKTKR